jgi:hypothetical protein
MSSGPAIVLVLDAEDGIRKWRTLMGATDPAKADAGTLRKEFGTSIENNATHGSDAPETAAFELVGRQVDGHDEAVLSQRLALFILELRLERLPDALQSHEYAQSQFVDHCLFPLRTS